MSVSVEGCSVLCWRSAATYISYWHPHQNLVPTLSSSILCGSTAALGGEGDGLVQRGGEGGQPDEVPVLPVSLDPLDVVLDRGAVGRRGGLAEVNHPNVRLWSNVVVDKEKRAANHLYRQVKDCCWLSAVNQKPTTRQKKCQSAESIILT